MAYNNSRDGISYFEEIDPPYDLQRVNTMKMLKGSTIIAIFIISLALGGYLYLKPKYDASDSSATITGFSRIQIEGDTHTFGVKLEIDNPSSEPFTIQAANMDLSIQNVTLFGTPDNVWVKLAENMMINSTYQINAKSTRTITLQWAFDSDDEYGIQFLYMALMHQNHTIKVEGTLDISLENPNKLSINTVVRANDLFEYDVTDADSDEEDEPISTHLLKNNDLISVPVDGVVDTTTNISIVSRYINPFNFPITITKMSYDLTNLTTKTWGVYNLKNPLELPANDYFNMTIMGDPEESEITDILSDLLSGNSDIFQYEDIHVSFNVGGILINGSKMEEIVKAEYSIKLEVAGYNLIGSGGFTIDMAFINPCGFAFNLTYIEIDIFITGTHQMQNAIWLHDYVSVEPYSYIPVRAYSTTIVEDIGVEIDTDYIDNILGGAQVDFIGFLTIDCYQYEDDIPFISLENDFITEEEE